MCYRCRRESPPCGFYPMLWSGGINLVTGEVKGGLLCWDCDREMRAGASDGVGDDE
jgi:hypothetical protein